MDLNVERLYEGFKKRIVIFGGDSAIQGRNYNTFYPVSITILTNISSRTSFSLLRMLVILINVWVRQVQGSWETEEVVQQILEPTGTAVPYGDTTNIPFGSWNLNYNYYTNVRFELGIEVTTLEQLQFFCSEC